MRRPDGERVKTSRRIMNSPERDATHKEIMAAAGFVDVEHLSMTTPFDHHLARAPEEDGPVGDANSTFDQVMMFCRLSGMSWLESLEYGGYYAGMTQCAEGHRLLEELAAGYEKRFPDAMGFLVG